MDKLKITGYEDVKLGSMIDTFEAQINPASISLSYSINYNKNEGQAVGNPEMQFAGGGTPKLSFDLIIDGTGYAEGVAFEGHSAMAAVDVVDKIEEFKKACYYYISGTHETPYVKVEWGKTLLKHKKSDFAGRLESLSISYNLFKNDGTPLRAKISASYVGTLDPSTDSKNKTTSSPDLTHLITIKAGDSLPTLCEKVYGNAQMCHQVAKINRITNFRKIEPGQVLEFPPMR